MSRIGRKPVELPSSVTFENNNGVVTVKGPLGTLTREFPSSDIKFTVENNQIMVTRDNDKDTTRALHGLYRQWTKRLDLLKLLKRRRKSICLLHTFLA